MSSISPENPKSDAGFLRNALLCIAMFPCAFFVLLFAVLAARAPACAPDAQAHLRLLHRGDVRVLHQKYVSIPDDEAHALFAGDDDDAGCGAPVIRKNFHGLAFQCRKPFI